MTTNAPRALTAFRYWAFISYAHTDEKAARTLHQDLETYTGHRRLPPGTTPTGEPLPPRLAPIFRDRDELGASGDLPGRLHEALEASRFLIVICSPAAARSQWVDAEIRKFKALGRSDLVLAYIVDGEPWASSSGGENAECFPAGLRHVVLPDGALADTRAEPLAADARSNADGRRNALLKIIAGMLGVKFDDLRRRDETRRRRQRLILASATLAGLLVLAGLGLYARLQGRNAAAEKQRAEARGLVTRATNAVARNQFDRAILLAVAASGFGDTPEVLSLVQTLQTVEPGLTRYLFAGEGAVAALAFDATGGFAAAATTSGTVTVLDLRAGQAAGPALKSDGAEIAALCFAGGNHNRLFAITTSDMLLDWPDGKTVRATSISDTTLQSAGCVPDRPLWRAVTEDNTVIEVNLDGTVPSSRVMFRMNEPATEFSANGKRLIGIDAEKFAVMTTNLENKSTTGKPLAGAHVRVNQIRTNADGTMLAVMEAGSPQIRLYRIDTGSTPPFTLQPPAAVVDLQFSPDSSMMAISMTGGVVGVVGREALALRRQLRAAATGGDVTGPVAFDPAGRILLSGTGDGRVVQWDPDPVTSVPPEVSTGTLNAALARLCRIANRSLSNDEIRDLPPSQTPVRTCAQVGSR